MQFSICHATRRPALALEQKARWLAAAKHPERVEYIFAIDQDAQIHETNRLLIGHAYVIVDPPQGCVAAFNAAAAASLGEIIIAGSDDTWPVQNWDELIIQRFQAHMADSETVGKRDNEPESVTVRFGYSCPKTVIGEIYTEALSPIVPQSQSPIVGPLSPLGPLVLLVGDGMRQDRLATMPVITRAWYTRFGFLFPPQFVSVGADVWITERAARDGCLVDATDLQFEHRHAYYGKAEMDDVYEEQNDPARYQLAETALTELLDHIPISLCMIVGNEAAIIERCLDSAKDAFDELCIVRAIGEQECDATIGRALSWCLKNKKKFRWKEHGNTTPGLTHVDDFAAARNLSFSLSPSPVFPKSAPWLLWLDADDLLDPAAVPIIRQHAARNTRFAAHAFPYHMPTGGIFPRERLIRQGAGRWVGAVHETCEITGDISNVYSAIVQHAPTSGSEKQLASAERNLKLLQLNPLPCRERNAFYLHEELMRLGRNEEAIMHGAVALALLKGSQYTAERYEVLLNMAVLCPEAAEGYWFDALQMDPLRREALSQLCQHALHSGDKNRAIIYFRWMTQIPVPVPAPWTHRAIWYGWATNYLRVRIFRAQGKLEEANSHHAKYLEDPAYAAGVAQFENS